MKTVRVGGKISPIQEYAQSVATFLREMDGMESMLTIKQNTKRKLANCIRIGGDECVMNTNQKGELLPGPISVCKSIRN